MKFAHAEILAKLRNDKHISAALSPREKYAGMLIWSGSSRRTDDEIYAQKRFRFALQFSRQSSKFAA